MLIAAVAGRAEAGRAIAAGADLIDISGCGPTAAAAIREAYPGVVWDAGRAAAGAGTAAEGAGTAAAVDADLVAAACAGPEPAAVIAVAAISAWLGAPAIRSRQVRAVRRAIDMTASIAGTRPPAFTIRGLA